MMLFNISSEIVVLLFPNGIMQAAIHLCQKRKRKKRIMQAADSQVIPVRSENLLLSFSEIAKVTDFVVWSTQIFILFIRHCLSHF
jgi:hypothetical protein